MPLKGFQGEPTKGLLFTQAVPLVARRCFTVCHSNPAVTAENGHVHLSRPLVHPLPTRSTLTHPSSFHLAVICSSLLTGVHDGDLVLLLFFR